MTRVLGDILYELIQTGSQKMAMIAMENGLFNKNFAQNLKY